MRIGFSSHRTARGTLAALAGLILAMGAIGLPKEGGALEIYWCDVEGGAATLIVTPAGESILVDSGFPGERDAGRIASIAREQAGLTKIDHYITTHFHRDHLGGIPTLIQKIPVGRSYDHGLPPLPKPDIQADLVEAYRRAVGSTVIVLRPGDEIPLRQAGGRPEVRLLVVASDGLVLGEASGSPQIQACTVHPPHEAKPEDTSDNARSIAFVLSFGSWRFFDGGDLTWNVEHKLACPRKLVEPVDVYQVTHHGLDSSNHPALMQALAPRVAVMNNGPRKGGAPVVVQALRALPGMEGLFALHRNVATSPEQNAPVDWTANDEEACEGHHVMLSVAPDAASYTVRVPSKSATRTFRTR